MPTYTYKCDTCDHSTEEFFSISKKPAAIVCPKCGEVADQEITGGTGFLLKGHGWGFDRYAGKSNFKMTGDDSD